MVRKTINNVDSNGCMITDETNNVIHMYCDVSHPCYILTTSPTAVARESILYVQGHGEYFCYAGSYTRRSNMQSYLIMLTLSGREVLEYEGKSYEMGPGTFYWIDCMKPHYAHTLSEDHPRHALWLHFYGASAEFYYRQYLRMNNNSNVCRLIEGSNIADNIKELIELYNNSTESLDMDIFASSIATNIITECIRATKAQPPHAPIPKIVSLTESYISQNYYEAITLDSLAERFAMNKYHLQKQFKRFIGISPSKYLIHTRISRAKELLRSTDNSIEKIAEEIGFGNVSNFTRAFKQYENITPTTYRKSWIEPQITILDEHSFESID